MSPEMTGVPPEPTYWFLRMRQGTGGRDYAEELWGQGLAGVLWGSWEIRHVLDSNGQIDETRLNAAAIKAQKTQPEWFNETRMRAPRTFLLEVRVGDRLLVVYGNALRIGVVGEGFLPDPDPPRGEYDEHFKCRPISQRRCFSLEKLPSSYRLIAGTGRGTIQRIRAYEHHVRLLDQSCTIEDLRSKLTAMPTLDFLEMLSDKQWEVVCAEYLRDEVGLRLLPLAIGGTLKNLDIVGVDSSLVRVVAQCKNTSHRMRVRDVAQWRRDAGLSLDDRKFFFCRGGFEGSPSEAQCTLVDGKHIAAWLEGQKDYLDAVKCK